ncbi:hypothetical protein T484DRAFT_3629548 [Baffinella frigidus]|nr:hypothetical protein T484DRAFT_3629548 [Cryptophyta sp. CCMP2293]
MQQGAGAGGMVWVVQGQGSGCQKKSGPGHSAVSCLAGPPPPGNFPPTAARRSEHTCRRLRPMDQRCGWPHLAPLPAKHFLKHRTEHLLCWGVDPQGGRGAAPWPTLRGRTLSARLLLLLLLLILLMMMSRVAGPTPAKAQCFALLPPFRSSAKKKRIFDQRSVLESNVMGEARENGVVRLRIYMPKVVVDTPLPAPNEEDMRKKQEGFKNFVIGHFEKGKGTIEACPSLMEYSPWKACSQGKTVKDVAAGALVAKFCLATKPEHEGIDEGGVDAMVAQRREKRCRENRASAREQVLFPSPPIFKTP